MLQSSRALSFIVRVRGYQDLIRGKQTLRVVAPRYLLLI